MKSSLPKTLFPFCYLRKKYIADRPTPSAWCDFDKVEQISLDDHPWNTKVRVLACWKNPDELLESESSCLEMVLIGAEVGIVD